MTIGNPVTVGSDTVYLYSDSTGNEAFYDASSGGTVIASATISDGFSSVNFWYEDDKAGTFTVTASDNATAPDGTTGIDDATDSVTVIAAATSQFTLNDPGSMTAGTRLGYVVTRKDAFNNLVPSGAQTYYNFSLQAAAAPPAPTGLRAAGTADGVAFSWEPVSGVSEYRLLSSTGIWGLVSASTSYFLHSLPANTSSHITAVAAVNLNGSSATATISATRACSWMSFFIGSVPISSSCKPTRPR